MLVKPKLIILDRDGVINYDSDNYIKSPEEWLPIPGSLEAICRLRNHGYLIAIATNQSGVARGLFNLETLDKIHTKMIDSLLSMLPDFKFDSIVSCIHHPTEECFCRKPKPGMLLNIATSLKITNSPKDIWFIGDSYRDCVAAMSANCLPILVRTGKGILEQEKIDHKTQDVLVFDDLAKVTDYLCKI